MLSADLRCVTLPEDTDPLSGDTASAFVPAGGHGDGTPFFLIPGFGLDGRSFGTLAPLAAGRRTVFWNPPNVLPGGDDLTAIARLALDHADLSGCDGKIVLGGASMGGMVALTAALLAPERVAGLVLLGTCSSWSEVSLPVRFAALWHGLTPRRHYHRILPHILIPGRHDASRASPVNDALREQMRHRTRAYGTRLVRALRRLDLRDRLREIDVPTLVVHGGRDRAIPPRAARTLSRIPRSRVVLLDGAGHVPFVSHGSACREALGSFLVEVDAHQGGRRL